jgi:hypothetical protein
VLVRMMRVCVCVCVFVCYCACLHAELGEVQIEYLHTYIEQLGYEDTYSWL